MGYEQGAAVSHFVMGRGRGKKHQVESEANTEIENRKEPNTDAVL